MTERVRLTTAQALIRFLENQYVKFDDEEIPFVEGVFNIFGHGNVLGIGQALEETNSRLKVYQGKNEQGMAHAATAFAKEKKRRQIYAVTSSVGPGSANLVTASATALANNIPVLFLPGDTFATRQPDPVLQQIEQYHSYKITTNDALQPVSRYWDRIERPEQLMSALIRAFEVLTNPETAGPVTLSISQDVEGEVYDFEASFFEKRVHYVDRTTPSDEALNRAVEKIKNAKKPLLVVGGGVKYSDAGKAVAAFAEKHEIALVETQAGKSAVSGSHPYNLGGLGVTGTLAANKAAKQADVVIGVGTRYTDFTSSSKTAFDYSQTSFVNINVSRMQTYKMDAHSLVGDAKATIELLTGKLEDYKSGFSSSIESLKKEWIQERNRLGAVEVDFDNADYKPEVLDGLGQERLKEYASALETTYAQTAALIKVNDTIGKTSRVVTSSGSLPGDMQRLWEAEVPDTYHVEYGYSTMGYEIAGALGVKLAQPDKEVYSMVGDGSFLMLHSELVTARQYDKKINIVLFDNSGYGCINNLQMGHGSSSFCTEFAKEDGTILTIDYAKVAEGYGLDTFTASNHQELEDSLKQAEQSTNSTLIHIKILPKTMTEGYESFWNVGISEHSSNPQVQKRAEDVIKTRSEARQY